MRLSNANFYEESDNCNSQRSLTKLWKFIDMCAQYLKIMKDLFIM